MEITLVILKPDAVQRGLIGRILSRFEDKGLKIVGARLLHITREMASKHYEEHQSKPFYESLLQYITSQPVMVLAVRGYDAVKICRKLMGSTRGYEAEPGTIRGDFCVSNTFNLIHGSDSLKSAQRELRLFFKDGEIFDYEQVLDPWLRSEQERPAKTLTSEGEPAALSANK